MKLAVIVTMLLVMGALAIAIERPRNDPKPKAIGIMTGSEDLRTATFAGGCFWCVEADFEKVDGVVEVISGYTGGEKDNPTYEEVSAGGTGHVEAIQVLYDPLKVSYKELLDVFWQHVDPTD